MAGIGAESILSGFEVFVLGSSGTYPSSSSATSGFLLRSDGSDVWIDAGTGTFSNLQRHTNYFDLEALFLSHLHLDHIMDVYPFYYALRYSPETRGPNGLPVFAPPGAKEQLERLASLTSQDGFGGFFDFRPIASGDEATVGPFVFKFQRTEHPVETFAMKIESAGRTLVYSADTALCDEVVKLAEGADVLIAEASMQRPVEGLAKVHMTAEEAGQMAKDAGVGRLVLTHIVPGQDSKISVDQASARFGGEVVAASDNLRFEV